MSIWSQLAALAARAFDAPSPALAGAADTRCAPDPGDVDFTAAIIGLGAKLARADGQVTADEVEVFARVFKAQPHEEAAVRRVFNLARQTVRGFESYARQIGRKYKDRPCLLEGVLDGLFEIAGADGVVTGDELAYLAAVATAFGFSESEFARIKASHLGPEPGDPYLVLELRRDASFAEVRAAYRRLMRQNHPDAAVGQHTKTGAQHDKAASITSAYARIRAERGFLTHPD